MISVSLLVNKWKRQGFLNEKDRQRLMIFLNIMRMVCNSTYILDQRTRHDTKIEELMNILDEVFAGGGEKAVVFSQWERMTRIAAEELDKGAYWRGSRFGKGESTLFMPAGQFKTFMSSVEKMMGEPQAKPVNAEANQEDEIPKIAAINPQEPANDEVATESFDSQPETPSIPEETKPTFEGDDDVAPAKATEATFLPSETQPEQLLQMGLSFLGSLGKTLSSPEATQRLIKSVVQKDETDGKTYLKIPVESEKIIENALSLFAGLLNSLKK